MGGGRMLTLLQHPCTTIAAQRFTPLECRAETDVEEDFSQGQLLLTVPPFRFHSAWVAFISGCGLCPEHSMKSLHNIIAALRALDSVHFSPNI